MHGTVIDVTERKLAEQTLGAARRPAEVAKDAAEAASAAKDRFLATLSHELRTPLTPVAMAVAVLENNPELPPAVRDELGMIGRNVALEVKLIDDLLDLSRVTSGKL